MTAALARGDGHRNLIATLMAFTPLPEARVYEETPRAGALPPRLFSRQQDVPSGVAPLEQLSDRIGLHAGPAEHRISGYNGAGSNGGMPMLLGGIESACGENVSMKNRV